MLYRNLDYILVVHVYTREGRGERAAMREILEQLETSEYTLWMLLKLHPGAPLPRLCVHPHLPPPLPAGCYGSKLSPSQFQPDPREHWSVDHTSCPPSGRRAQSRYQSVTVYRLWRRAR